MVRSNRGFEVYSGPESTAVLLMLMALAIGVHLAAKRGWFPMKWRLLVFLMVLLVAVLLGALLGSVTYG